MDMEYRSDPLLHGGMFSRSAQCPQKEEEKLEEGGIESHAIWYPHHYVRWEGWAQSVTAGWRWGIDSIRVDDKHMIGEDREEEIRREYEGLREREGHGWY